ncbi:MAG: alkaline phosphatase family protein [Thermoplasmata archaeon]
MAARTVVIGIDGVSYGIIQELSRKGDMPNFASLKDEGNFSKMRSAVPEVSNVNWSSIVTGKNPGEHGVFGFTELIEGTYTISFPDRRSLKALPFWEDSSNRYVIINVPAMYPAPDINGIFVSGFVSLDLARSVSPASALPFFEEIGYKIDVDSSKAQESLKVFTKDLFETLKKREIVCNRYLKKNWDYFMLVFTGSDRLGHFLIDAYHHTDHEYHQVFLDYFREIDRIIGDIVMELKEGDRLVMISDHGMEPIKRNVNVNSLLEAEGYLQLGDRPEQRYNNIKEKTKAFALDPGRIYLNRTDRYPRGEVESGEEVVDELVSLFKDLRFQGERVIKKIHRKEGAYHGPHLNTAPDLILTPSSGYNLKGSVKYNSLFEQNIFKGKHTEHDAFLYCNDLALPKHPKVEDVRSIIQGDQHLR